MSNLYFTKVIATLGPSSNTYDTIAAMVRAGVDVFRLNFSHGHVEDHAACVAHVRQAESHLGRTVAVMADLQGPKFRIGDITKGGVHLSLGQEVRFVQSATASSPQDSVTLPLPHPEIFQALKPGAKLLLDDGKMAFEVLSVEAESCLCRTCTPGTVMPRKGVNVPYLELPTSALTPKDRRDMKAALEMGVDAMALSFVQRPGDVLEARGFMDDVAKDIGGRSVPIVSKLEKPSAIDNLEGILAVSDMIMIARGDLGVELPCEDVPPLQRRIITACRREGIPVIVATQMLESMVVNPSPTRAEASDVATAVYEGADAVMLSAESASGAYPIAAVETMRRIIAKVEQDPVLVTLLEATKPVPRGTVQDAISSSIKQVADQLNIAVIVTFTEQGGTALSAARQRPHVPILGITPHIRCARKLAFVWGVVPSAMHGRVETVDDILPLAYTIIKDRGLWGEVSDHPYRKIIVTAGMPFGVPGTTNMFRVADLKG